MEGREKSAGLETVSARPKRFLSPWKDWAAAVSWSVTAGRNLPSDGCVWGLYYLTHTRQRRSAALIFATRRFGTTVAVRLAPC